MRVERAQASLSLILIILLLGFPQVSETIYTPSLPDLAHSLGISSQWAELTLSIYFIGFALGVAGWGIVADYRGRRPALLMGLFFYCVGSAGCYQAGEIGTLLAWRFLQAFGASAGSVVTQTMIRDLYSGAERGKIFSAIGGALAFSPAIGPVIGGWVDQFAGWRGNFVVLVTMGIGLFIYCYRQLPETKNEAVLSLASFKQVAKQFMGDRRLYGYVTLIGCCNGIMFSYYAEAPFIFIEYMQYTPGQYGLVGLIIAGSNIVASYLSHRLNHRLIRPESLIHMGCLIIMIASLGLSVWGYWELFVHSPVMHLTVFMGCISLLFFGIGFLVPNALSQALIDYQKAMGTAGALFGLLYYLLIAAITFFMSYLHNGSIAAMPLYFLGLSGIMLMAFYAWIETQTLITTQTCYKNL